MYVAVQKGDSVTVKLLLKYSPAELLYTENSVGQTPLDIASLNGLPRPTVYGITGPADLSLNIEQYLRAPQNISPFNVEKQKVETPKLRATLDTLLAEGCIAHGTKLTTEFLAFADRMEEWHAEEIARKDAAEKLEQEGEFDPPPSHNVTPRVRTLCYVMRRQRAREYDSSCTWWMCSALFNGFFNSNLREHWGGGASGRGKFKRKTGKLT